MRKISIAILTAFVALGTSLPARAENSVACSYMLMRIYHEHMKVCGTPLPRANETRFLWMKGQFEKFIYDNAVASPEKIIANVDKKVTESLKNVQCNSMDFARAKSTMESYTSSARAQEFKDSLSYPRNPLAGTCG